MVDDVIFQKQNARRRQRTPETGIKECNKCVRGHACCTQTDAAAHHKAIIKYAFKSKKCQKG